MLYLTKDYAEIYCQYFEQRMALLLQAGIQRIQATGELPGRLGSKCRLSYVFA